MTDYDDVVSVVRRAIRTEMRSNNNIIIANHVPGQVSGIPYDYTNNASHIVSRFKVGSGSSAIIEAHVNPMFPPNHDAASAPMSYIMLLPEGDLKNAYALMPWGEGSSSWKIYAPKAIVASNMSIGASQEWPGAGREEGHVWLVMSSIAEMHWRVSGPSSGAPVGFPFAHVARTQAVGGNATLFIAGASKISGGWTGNQFKYAFIGPANSDGYVSIGGASFMHHTDTGTASWIFSSNLLEEAMMDIRQNKYYLRSWGATQLFRYDYGNNDSVTNYPPVVKLIGQVGAAAGPLNVEASPMNSSTASIYLRGLRRFHTHAASIGDRTSDGNAMLIGRGLSGGDWTDGNFIHSIDADGPIYVQSARNYANFGDAVTFQTRNQSANLTDRFVIEGGPNTATIWVKNSTLDIADGHVLELGSAGDDNVSATGPGRMFWRSDTDKVRVYDRAAETWKYLQYEGGGGGDYTTITLQDGESLQTDNNADDLFYIRSYNGADYTSNLTFRHNSGDGRGEMVLNTRLELADSLGFYFDAAAHKTLTLENENGSYNANLTLTDGDLTLSDGSIAVTGQISVDDVTLNGNTITLIPGGTIDAYFDGGDSALHILNSEYGFVCDVDIDGDLTVAGTISGSIDADTLDTKDSAAFLLVDGTDQMEGDLNMNSNDITNVATVDIGTNLLIAASLMTLDGTALGIQFDDVSDCTVQIDNTSGDADLYLTGGTLTVVGSAVIDNVGINGNTITATGDATLDASGTIYLQTDTNTRLTVADAQTTINNSKLVCDNLDLDGSTVSSSADISLDAVGTVYLKTDTVARVTVADAQTTINNSLLVVDNLHMDGSTYQIIDSAGVIDVNDPADSALSILNSEAGKVCDVSIDGDLTVGGTLSGTLSGYVKADGTVPMTGNWAFGGFELTGLTNLDVDYVNINGAAITSDTGAMSIQQTASGQPLTIETYHETFGNLVLQARAPIDGIQGSITVGDTIEIDTEAATDALSLKTGGTDRLVLDNAKAVLSLNELEHVGSTFAVDINNATDSTLYFKNEAAGDCNVNIDGDLTIGGGLNATKIIGAITLGTDNTYDIGTDAARVKDLYVRGNIACAGGVDGVDVSAHTHSGAGQGGTVATSSLSGHDKAAHDALNIDADTLDGHDTGYFAVNGDFVNHSAQHENSGTDEISLTGLSGESAELGTHKNVTTAIHGVGAGAIVGTTLAQVLTQKTLTTPTIGDFTNAQHAHAAAASGGTIAHSSTTGQTATDHHAKGVTVSAVSPTSGAGSANAFSCEDHFHNCTQKGCTNYAAPFIGEELIFGAMAALTNRIEELEEEIRLLKSQ